MSIGWTDYLYDYDYDEDEEEGENPMNYTEKKYLVSDISRDCYRYATLNEALDYAKRASAGDRSGDPYGIFLLQQYARAKVPEVDVVQVS